MTLPYQKPLPQPDADTAPFWAGCREHKLLFQKCASCGHVRWPPSIICPVCHAPDTEWITASGKGSVYTFTVFHTALHEAFLQDIPYVTAVIELEEGPHLLSNIIECEHSNIRCGMPVAVTWEDINEEFSLPKFKPV